MIASLACYLILIELFEDLFQIVLPCTNNLLYLLNDLAADVVDITEVVLVEDLLEFLQSYFSIV